MITSAHSIRSPALRIESGFVYTNDAGEQRLLVLVDRYRANPVVVWRTANPKLPHGAKAQGSATIRSFLRWAVSMRKATKDDWDAFEEVERLRRWRRDEQRFIREHRRKRLAQGR